MKGNHQPEQISDILNRIFEELQVIRDGLLEREKPFMDINEVSKYLIISKSTIYSYCSIGLIPHFKTGKKLWFSMQEIDDWILNRKNRRRTVAEIKHEAADMVIEERS